MAAPPQYPSYFLKPPSSLSAPRGRGRPTRAAVASSTTRARSRLVIGSALPGRLDRAEALDHVAGYTVANDFGVHDFRHIDRGSMLRVKGQDGFCPLGPAIVDAADVDPGDLTVRTFVNGEQVQEGHTGDDLLFGFDYQVADVSRLITLEPGDVLLTGTPANSRPVEPGRRGRGRGRRHRPAAQPDRRARPRPRGRRLAARGQRPDAARRARDARGRGRARGRRGDRWTRDPPAGPPRRACASPIVEEAADALGRPLRPDPRRCRRRARCCAAPTRTSASSCARPTATAGIEHVAYELRSGVSLADAAERAARRRSPSPRRSRSPSAARGLRADRPRRQRDRARRARPGRGPAPRRSPATPTSCPPFTRGGSSTSTT